MHKVHRDMVGCLVVQTDDFDQISHKINDCQHVESDSFTADFKVPWSYSWSYEIHSKVQGNRPASLAAV
jgi:hypothetical protein